MPENNHFDQTTEGCERVDASVELFRVTFLLIFKEKSFPVRTFGGTRSLLDYIIFFFY